MRRRTRRSPPRPPPRESSARSLPPASSSADFRRHGSLRQGAETTGVHRVRPVGVRIDRGALEPDVPLPAGEQVHTRAAHHHAVGAALGTEAEVAAAVRLAAEPAAVLDRSRRHVRPHHLRPALLAPYGWQLNELALSLVRDTAEHEARHDERDDRAAVDPAVTHRVADDEEARLGSRRRPGGGRGRECEHRENGATDQDSPHGAPRVLRSSPRKRFASPRSEKELRAGESAVSPALRAVFAWDALGGGRSLSCARARQRPARARSGLRLSPATPSLSLRPAAARGSNVSNPHAVQAKRSARTTQTQTKPYCTKPTGDRALPLAKFLIPASECAALASYFRSLFDSMSNHMAN